MSYVRNRATNKHDKWVGVLDVLFYLFAIAMVVIFLLTRRSAPWAFLYAGGAALVARVAGYIVRQSKR